jgi:hypothetical protein
VFYKIEYQFGWDADKAMYWVVYYFLFIQGMYLRCKIEK